MSKPEVSKTSNQEKFTKSLNGIQQIVGDSLNESLNGIQNVVSQPPPQPQAQAQAQEVEPSGDGETGGKEEAK